MTTNPTFQLPATAVESGPTSPIIEVDKALESMRDSGFDLMAAIGEPIDNSIEANATLVRILPVYSNDKKHITEIAFADNGRGINLAEIAQVLKMGYSSRYGQRKGLGRFGVGLKLAGLSVGTRIEVITKAAGSDEYYRVYLDLELIKTGEQSVIKAEKVDGWPMEYAELMSAKGEEFQSGTLVLWQHIDRLSSGGTYGASLESKIQDMRKFIARVYREFINNGLVIELEGRPTSLHDPLFLLDNPRILNRYRGRPEEQLKGRIIDQAELAIDGYAVQVTATIAPETFRHKSGDGGNFDTDGKDIREFQIKDNQGRISMLRNGREIYYDIVPRILPSGVDKVDRYIGIEVSFPAELDEYFQVRHVKRGAEPVNKLREELRTWLERPIKLARSQIRRHWNEVEVAERGKSGDGRSPALLDAVERSEQTTPHGQAGLDVTEERQEESINQLLEDLDIDTTEDPENADRIRKQIQEHPMTIVDGAWPGKELMEIDHFNGKAVVRINHRHPFIRDIYDALREVAQKMPDEQNADEMHDLIRRTWMGLDVLFLAYAKAENLHRDPEIFDDLRSYWGQHTQAYMKELARTEE